MHHTILGISDSDDAAHNESPVLSQYRLACESAG